MNKDTVEEKAKKIVQQLDHGIIRLENRCTCGRHYITAVKNTPEDERIIAAALVAMVLAMGEKRAEPKG